MNRGLNSLAEVGIIFAGTLVVGILSDLDVSPTTHTVIGYCVGCIVMCGLSFLCVRNMANE